MEKLLSGFDTLIFDAAIQAGFLVRAGAWY
jgi:hypothetical protein